MKKLKKIVITIIKISISILLLYFVFRKVPFAEVWSLVKESKPLYLVLGLMTFTYSQLLSSTRLLSFFHTNGYLLKAQSNWKLYLIGMFYNFFIPGGIGGDAYKVYVLNKKFDWSVKKLTTSVFCDRLSGLMAICFLILLLSAKFLPGYWWTLLIPTIPIAYFIARFLWGKLFNSFSGIFNKALLYSLGVQGLQLLSIFFILNSFTSVDSVWIYFMVFLLSSILSLISFSGIGVREWLFMQAANYYAFDAGVSVSTAMLFSIMTALVSLVGLIYQLTHFSLEKEG